MNRAEHLQWCKDLAMGYVKSGNLRQAVTSMLSDLSKHEETEASSRGVCAQIGMLELMRTPPTREGIEKYIKGFT